jgi:hypothetical protein
MHGTIYVVIFTLAFYQLHGAVGQDYKVRRTMATRAGGCRYLSHTPFRDSSSHYQAPNNAGLGRIKSDEIQNRSTRSR